jgi:putative membrane protein
MSEKKDLSKPSTPLEYIRLFFTGFVIGSADLVPGVSGGTMAFILGVYEELLDGIKSFNLQAIRLALGKKFGELFEHIPFRFLIALGLGVATAVLLLAGVLSSILDDPTGRIYLFAFFFGLVVASIIAVAIKLKWSLLTIIPLIITTIVAFLIVNLTPVVGDPTPINLFIAGMIAICAMIMPGISGSFILLIMGYYNHVLTAVSNRDFVTVAIVAAGCAVGIIIFSRVLSWLLKHYYQPTVAALVGFMIGSLWKIYPWKNCTLEGLDRHGDVICLAEANYIPEASSAILIALGLAVAGFLLVSFLDHLQSRENPVFKWLPIGKK